MPTGPVLSNDTTACSLALSSVLSDSQRHMHRNQYMTQCWLQHCRRTQLMPATHAQLAQENCMKNSTQVRHSFLHQYNSLRPITLHGLCHVPDSFCAGIELCSIACKKLVPLKTCTRLTDTRTSFLYKTTCTNFSSACRRH